MKGFKFSCIMGWLATALLLFISTPQSLHAQAKHIVIVKSSNNSYFSETAETIISNSARAARFTLLQLDSNTMMTQTLNQADIIIALGADAVVALNDIAPQKLVINAYLTDEQYQRIVKPRNNSITVLLDQPLERYLAFSQALLGLDTLGMINRSVLKFDGPLKLILDNLNLTVNQYQLANTQQLLAITRQLLQQNQALLMLPDQSIYNRDTLKGLLLTSYRNRVPVISYSPAQVTSGALAAIYSSPEDIGRQIANILNQHGASTSNFHDTAVYAQYYSIATNPHVAHALDLSLSDEATIRQALKEFDR